MHESDFRNMEKIMNKYIRQNFTKKEIKKIKHYFAILHFSELNRDNKLLQEVQKIGFLPTSKEYHYYTTLIDDVHFDYYLEIEMLKDFIENPSENFINPVSLSPIELKKEQRDAKMQLKLLEEEQVNIERVDLNTQIDKAIKKLQELKMFQKKINKAQNST